MALSTSEGLVDEEIPIPQLGGVFGGVGGPQGAFERFLRAGAPERIAGRGRDGGTAPERAQALHQLAGQVRGLGKAARGAHGRLRAPGGVLPSGASSSNWKRTEPSAPRTLRAPTRTTRRGAGGRAPARSFRGRPGGRRSPRRRNATSSAGKAPSAVSSAGRREAGSACQPEAGCGSGTKEGSAAGARAAAGRPAGGLDFAAEEAFDHDVAGLIDGAAGELRAAAGGNGGGELARLRAGELQQQTAPALAFQGLPDGFGNAVVVARGRLGAVLRAREARRSSCS